MEFIETLFKIGYDAFQLESPFFGLTYWDISIGIFAVSLSIGLFKTFFTMNVKPNGRWKDKEYKTR